MSLERTFRDILVHDIKWFILIGGIVTVISYIVTQDEKYLIGGFVFILFVVFAAIAKYVFWADTIMTHVRKWR